LRPTLTGRYIGSNVVGTRQSGVNGSEFIYNAALSLIDDNGVWSATVECKNCGDEEYITSFLFGSYWTPPGVWQARVRVNFGQR